MKTPSSHTTEAVELVTITAFIEENHKTLAVIGVLTALTVFWGNLPTGNIASDVPFFCLLATIPLFWEVARKVSSERSTWSLMIFINLFTIILLRTAWFAIVGFREDWQLQMPALIFCLILFLMWVLYNRLNGRPLVEQLVAKYDTWYAKRTFRARGVKYDQLPQEKRAEIDDGLSSLRSDLIEKLSTLWLVLYVLITITLGLVISKPLGNLVNFQFDKIHKSYQVNEPSPTPTPTPGE